MRIVASSLLALVFVVAAPVSAQPLAERIPADALLYVGWAGAEKLGPAYGESRLKGVVDASNLPELFAQLGPSVARRLAQEQDPQVQAFVNDVLPTLLAASGPLWRYPTAVYVGPMDFGGKVPLPRLAVMCQAGKDAQGLVDAIAKLTAKIPADAPLRLTAQLIGGDMLVVSNIAFPEKIEETLAAKPQFVSAMKHGVASPALAVWFDAEKVINLVSLAMTLGADARTSQTWRSTLFATGLGGVKRVCVTAGFDGRDWGTRAYLEMPKAARTGVLASLLENGPIADELFKLAPSGTAWLAATRLDLGKLLTDGRAAVKQLDANASREVDAAIAQVNEVLGLDVRTDVLAHLGDQWLLFNAPTAATGLPGLTLASPLRDAAKAEKSLVALGRLANAELAEKQAGNRGPIVAIESSKINDLTVHALAVPVASPCWTISGGTLYGALYPQTLVAATTERDAARSVLDDEKFQAARKRLGVAGSATSLTYFDLPRLAPRGYPMVLALQQAAVGLANLAGVETPTLVLPPLNQMAPHLSTAASATWSDEAGWYYRSVTPFPAAELLAGEAAVVRTP